MSNQIKLFGLRGSVFTRYALMTLDEAGVAYDMVIVPLDQLKSADHLARHPFGKVPVLHDGELELFESRAISRHIASHYDRQGTLYPSDPRTRALIEQWISVEQSYFRSTEEIAIQLVFSKLFGYQPDLEKARDATNRLKTTLEILDRHLSTSTYFVGDKLTLAGIPYAYIISYHMLIVIFLDIVFMPFTHLLSSTIQDLADLFASYKNFTRWWRLVSERPTWKKIITQSEF
jgi:glutathione S-transferase